MKLERILPFARSLLAKAIKPGDAAVDGTLGNGHDAELLCELVGEHGQVFGFDIQETAIQNSLKRIEENHFEDRVTFFHKGHEYIEESIPSQYHGKITAAIFNLGYLPGGDKSIVTKPITTISAIEGLLSLMAPEGIIVLVIYHGHSEGEVERDILLQYVEKIEQKKRMFCNTALLTKSITRLLSSQLKKEHRPINTGLCSFSMRKIFSSPYRLAQAGENFWNFR